MFKPLILAAVLLLVGIMSFAQYKSTPFFGPEAKPPSKLKLTEGLAVDSSATKQDIIHIIATVGYSTGNQLMAGTGGVWLHQTANGSGGWNTPYGAGVILWALGSVAPSVQNPASFAVGPVVTVLNGWVTVGGARDFINKKYIAVLNVSYTFLK